jgi:hypothetical protein
MGGEILSPIPSAYSFTSHQTPTSARVFVRTPFPPLGIDRKIRPSVIWAAATHTSIAFLTQAGTGTVRFRPRLPRKSTITQRFSRCSTWPTSSATSSDLRNPQPMSTARIARSRFPWRVEVSGARSSSRACSRVSQFPALTPSFLTPLTLTMPAARFASSKRLSAASAASFRMAETCTLMVEGASFASLKATRYS